MTFEPVKNKRGEVKLTWKQLVAFSENSLSGDIPNVRYKLVYTNNPSVNLESVCAVQRHSDVKHISDELSSDNLEYTANLDFNKDYYINVVAIMHDQQE